MTAELPITVIIPGIPVAQGRGRAVPTPAGIRVMDPKRSRSWKGAAQVHMLAAMRGRKALDGPLEVRIFCVWPPSGPPRKKTPRPACWRAKKPDADNLAKGVLDAGNAVLWKDDAQIVRLVVEKWHGEQGDDPHVLVEVQAIGGE